MNACPGCGAPFQPSLPDQHLCDACSGLVAPEQSSPLQEARVGAYKLVHQLGAGRFSTSWLAEPSDGSGGVVLKLLRAYAPDGETVERFIAEARRLSLPGPHDHPGVARVLEAGVQIGGALFVVYESGGETTLADELRGRGRLLPGRALELCGQLCDALHALHAAGHRQLGVKPANVGLAKDDRGIESAVLLDAFTAHLLQQAGLRETVALPISTAAYLSPEEAAGLQPDGRADLYAVGVLLFQLISGRLPIMGTTTEQLLDAHQSQKPLRLRDVGRRLHADVEAALARLLSRDPGARFQTGREAAQALRAAAPHADQAAEEEQQEEVEDPVPVAGGAPEPEATTAPANTSAGAAAALVEPLVAAATGAGPARAAAPLPRSARPGRPAPPRPAPPVLAPTAPPAAKPAPQPKADGPASGPAAAAEPEVEPPRAPRAPSESPDDFRVTPTSPARVNPFHEAAAPQPPRRAPAPIPAAGPAARSAAPMIAGAVLLLGLVVALAVFVMGGNDPARRSTRSVRSGVAEGPPPTGPAPLALVVAPPNASAPAPASASASAAPNASAPAASAAANAPAVHPPQPDELALSAAGDLSIPGAPAQAPRPANTSPRVKPVPARPQPVRTPPAPKPAAEPAPKTSPSESPKSAKAAQAKPRAKAELDEAQLLIKSEEFATAINRLRPILAREDLGDVERGRALRLMAEAHVQRGDRQGGVDWYKKYLHLVTDEAERARVLQLLQTLNP